MRLTDTLSAYPKGYTKLSTNTYAIYRFTLVHNVSDRLESITIIRKIQRNRTGRCTRISVIENYKNTLSLKCVWYYELHAVNVYQWIRENYRFCLVETKVLGAYKIISATEFVYSVIICCFSPKNIIITRIVLFF